MTWHRILCTCLYAVLLCSSFGAVSDSRAQLTADQLTADRLCAALDMSAGDCARIASISTLPPTGLALPPLFRFSRVSIPVSVPWFVSPVASQGINSLRSGDVDNLQASCLVLGVTLPADTLVSFSLRTNSEGFYDRLLFSADNQILIENFSAALRSTLRDWEQFEFRLENSISSLTWCYLKDRAETLLDDSGWLDRLGLAPVEVLSAARVCAALDLSEESCSSLTNFSFEPPDSMWYASSVATEGDHSLHSGAVSDDQQSCLVLGLSLPIHSVISFASRISSGSGADQLQVAAGQLRLDTIFAAFDQIEGEWRQQSYFLPAAISTLSWCYVKDSANSRGEGRVWIDRLSFSTSQLSYRSRLCAALDLADCAIIESVSLEPPQLPWVITGATFVAGGSSLRSPDIDDDQQSCLVLGLSLPANSVISFASRTSSEGGADQLEIAADQLRLDTLSAAIFGTERPWRQTRYFLPAAISTLSWCYVKDSANSRGEDRVWIDRLSFSTSQLSYQSRICSALDLADCAIIESVSFEPPPRLWVITEGTFVAGGSSLRSPDIDDDQQSCLVLGLSLPIHSVISFASRTSSEGGADQLEIAADQLRLDTLSAGIFGAERPWRQTRYFLPAAISTLSWCYVKDSANSLNNDSVWIDRLSFSTSNISYRSRLCTALDLADCAAIESISLEPPLRLWVITEDTSVAGGSSLHSPDIDDDQQSCLVLGLSLPIHSVISFASRTSSEGGLDRLLIHADELRIDTLSADVFSTERPWRQADYFLPAAISTLSWCYVKDSANSRGEDRVWIDSLSFSTSNISYRSRICKALDLTDCAIIKSVSFEPPQWLWVITEDSSVAGGSSLRSGGISDNQQSCLVLGLSLPIHSVISFASRTNSEGGFDQLLIHADKLRLDTLSADVFSTTRPWRQADYFLPAAISTLSWCYVKDSANSRGEDSAWIDSLSFSTSNISYRSRICTALDLADCALIESISLEPPQLLWVITEDTFVAGGSSLHSPDIGDDQQSCLVLGLSLPANSFISFASRTSSEGRADQLEIAADRLRLDAISAAFFTLKRWSQTDYFLPAAISTLSWCYVKDSANSRGEDRAWIDRLSFSTSQVSYQSRLCKALDLADCALIESVSFEPPQLPWIITEATFVAGGSSLHSPDIDDNQQRCLLLGLSLPANSFISFARHTNFEGEADRLEITADQLRLDTFSASISTLRPWRQTGYFLPAAISTLSWCYVKGSANLEGEGRVWIDRLSFSTSQLSYQSRLCKVLDLADCALIESVSFEPPQLLWVITEATSVAGGSSLHSPDIGDDQQSCLVLGLNLPANSVITVAGRTNSQGGFDQLQLIADELRLNTISAEVGQIKRDWRQTDYFLPTAISTLSWCYVKDSTNSRGEDRAWIDSLSFSTSNISYQSRLCAALDLTDCAIIKSVSFEPPQRLWVITEATSVAGGSSLHSPDIGDDQQSCLVLGLNLPANSVITAAGRTNSQGGFDQLLIIADELRLDTISAEVGGIKRDWSQSRYFLPTAISTLSWCYAKDSTNSRGEDRAWIDSLSFSTSNISYQSRICAALDLTDCAIIKSVSFEPPQRLWVITEATSVAGGSSLHSPDIGDDQQSCLVLGLNLPAHSVITVAGRTNSQGGADQLQVIADNLRLDTISAEVGQIKRDWSQSRYFLPTAISALRWCYAKDSTNSRGEDRAWIDNFMLVTPADRYSAEIAVSNPVITAIPPNSFRFQVTVTAVSATLPPPLDWVLIASGIDNISGADTTYALVFSGNSARVDVLATPDNPLLPSSMLLALEDRPLLHSTAITTLTVRLPNTRRLAVLEITVPTAVTQTAPDAAIEIAVVASATDNFGLPFEPTGLTLVVEGVDNADVPQSTYALTFADGLAQTTITVGLTRRGDAGSIEVSVIGGDLVTTASIALSPAPRVLASITLSATDSNLAQTTASTAVAAELILTALDNYGDPIGAGDIGLQLFASNGAIVQSSLTLMIEADGTARQTVEILPQNDLDTVVTVLILRGTLEPSVQLLPDGGIRLAVRALRVLRQLQLSLVGAQSPLRQINPSLPVLASIHLTGLDQYDQPIAFPEVMLTTAAEPSTTVVTLNPQQAASTAAAGVLIMLEVVLSERRDTTITIAIAGAVVTTNQLVVRALYDRRPPIRSLNIDNTETDVTELDLIVALRWLTDQQSSTQSLVANLAITSTRVMTAGIDNLQQLFTKDIDRVDVNRDGRADQLDLRILVRYMSGLRGGALAEQEVVDGLIRLLLDEP